MMSPRTRLSSCRIALSAATLAVLLVGCSQRKADKADKAAAQTTDKMDAAAPADAAPAADAAKPAEADPGEGYAGKAKAKLVGTRAPAAAMKLLSGAPVALGEYLGKRPVYLKFWATWCVPCREQMPHFEAAYQKYGDLVAFFAVDLGLNDSIEAVEEFRKKHPMTMPIVFDFDGRLAEQLNVQVTPQHILIDRSGVVRYVGHATNAELDRAIEEIANEAKNEAKNDTSGKPGAASGKPAPAAKPDKPAAAPADGPLALQLTDGTTFRLDEHTGAPFALTFLSTWCDWYLAESRPQMSAECIDHTEKAEEQRRANPTLTWLFIASPVWTSPDDVAEMRKKFALEAAMGIDVDSTWFRRFEVRDVPTTLLLDAKGKELRRLRGGGGDIAKALKESL